MQFRRSTYFLLAIAWGIVLGIPQTAAQQQVRVGISLPNLSSPFFDNIRNEAEQEANQLGGVAVIVTSSENDSARQIADIETMVSQGAQAIIVVPTGGEISPVLQSAIDHGVWIVTVMTPVGGVNGSIAHIGVDFLSAGAAIASFVDNTTQNSTGILHLRGRIGEDTDQLSRGLLSVFDRDREKFRVREALTDFDPSREQHEVEAALQTNPPDVIIADTDEMAIGAARTIQTEGRNDIRIFGIGGSQRAIDAIRQNLLVRTVELYPGQQAHIAMDVAVNIVRNRQTPQDHVILVQPNLVVLQNIDNVYVNGASGDNGCSVCPQDQICCKGECKPKSSCQVPQSITR